MIGQRRDRDVAARARSTKYNIGQRHQREIGGSCRQGQAADRCLRITDSERERAGVLILVDRKIGDCGYCRRRVAIGLVSDCSRRRAIEIGVAAITGIDRLCATGGEGQHAAGAGQSDGASGRVGGGDGDGSGWSTGARRNDIQRRGDRDIASLRRRIGRVNDAQRRVGLVDDMRGRAGAGVPAGKSQVSSAEVQRGGGTTAEIAAAHLANRPDQGDGAQSTDTIADFNRAAWLTGDRSAGPGLGHGDLRRVGLTRHAGIRSVAGDLGHRVFAGCEIPRSGVVERQVGGGNPHVVGRDAHAANATHRKTGAGVDADAQIAGSTGWVAELPDVLQRIDIVVRVALHPIQPGAGQAHRGDIVVLHMALRFASECALLHHRLGVGEAQRIHHIAICIGSEQVTARQGGQCPD